MDLKYCSHCNGTITEEPQNEESKEDLEEIEPSLTAAQDANGQNPQRPLRSGPLSTITRKSSLVTLF
jgi:hypothetical protein